MHADRETPVAGDPEKGQHLLKARTQLRKAHGSLAEPVLGTEKINQHRHEPAEQTEAKS